MDGRVKWLVELLGGSPGESPGELSVQFYTSVLYSSYIQNSIQQPIAINVASTEATGNNQIGQVYIVLVYRPLTADCLAVLLSDRPELQACYAPSQQGTRVSTSPLRCRAIKALSGLVSKMSAIDVLIKYNISKQ